MSRQAEAFLPEIQVLVFHEAVSFQWICLTGTWTVCSQSLTSCHHYSSRGSPTLHLSAHTLCLQTVVTFRDISPYELYLSLQMMAPHYHYLKLFYRDDLPWIQMEVVQFSGSVVSSSLWPHGLQHTRLPCLSPTPRACSNSSPSSWWCHPTIKVTQIFEFRIEHINR